MITGRFFFILAFIVSGISPGHASEEKKGLIEASENQIHELVLHETSAESRLREHILKLTPMGTSPAQTLKVIAREYPKSAVSGPKKNFYMLSPDSSQGLLYITECIGINIDSASWFGLVATRQMVIWYFDQRDDLFNVTVHQSFVGP
jgi:hypothetical protein